MKKTNYQVTIGYKAVVNVEVKAETEKEAKEKAMEVFKAGNKFNKCYLQDDTYRIDGILDMDSTYNML